MDRRAGFSCRWRLHCAAGGVHIQRAIRGTVVETFGKTWLLTIAERGWRSSGGTRVAEIGPLPQPPPAEFSAMYMEATFVPGGSPMALLAIGKETRRSIVLTLHDSSQPASTFITDWTPKGLCAG